MKRAIVLASGVLAIAACQDSGTPTDANLSDASFARSSATVDVIVALRSDFAPGGHAQNQSRAEEIARELGVSPRFAYGTALFGFAATIPEGRMNGLRNDPRVDFIDFDAPVSIPDVVACRPGTCGGGGSTGQVVPWGIARTGADENSNTGEGIRVYILDTGIDLSHSDLAANVDIESGFAAEACKGGACVKPWHDDHDHGTHVAGTVGALDNDIDVVGVAPRVTMHAVKVLSKAGSGSRSGVIAGVDWVANETRKLGVATVANMSLGGSGSKTGTCTSSGFSGTDTYHAAICNAKNVGVVFVVAAGNDGANAAGSVPAAYYDAVITVSATTCTRDGQVCRSGTDNWTSWSNWGHATDTAWPSNGSLPVIIAAPGQGTLSTKRGGGTVSMSGTSMASPHGAGAAALFLKSKTQKPDGSAFSNTRGGLLNAAEGTGGWSNTSGNPHTEAFLRAGSL
jgi:subtilisin